MFHIYKSFRRRDNLNSSGEEVDLSEEYFHFQISSVLDKGTRKIRLKVTDFQSPRSSQSWQNSDLHGTASDGFDSKMMPISKRRLEERAPVRRELILFSQFPPNITSLGEKPLLPLERYVRKQQQTVTEIKKDLENGRKKLSKFDKNLVEAGSQNSGHLVSCGNCHLKIGHTRKLVNLAHAKLHSHAVYSLNIQKKKQLKPQ